MPAGLVVGQHPSATAAVSGNEPTELIDHREAHHAWPTCHHPDVFQLQRHTRHSQPTLGVSPQHALVTLQQHRTPDIHRAQQRGPPLSPRSFPCGVETAHDAHPTRLPPRRRGWLPVRRGRRTPRRVRTRRGCLPMGRWVARAGADRHSRPDHHRGHHRCGLPSPPAPIGRPRASNRWDERSAMPRPVHLDSLPHLGHPRARCPQAS